MKKSTASAKEITFYSKKCDRTLSVLGAEARAFAEVLEKDDCVQRYECNIVFRINSAEVQCFGLRASYVEAEWVSDFLIEYVDGRECIVDVVRDSDLARKSEAEKLELARRHWASQGMDWKVFVAEDTTGRKAKRSSTAVLSSQLKEEI